MLDGVRQGSYCCCYSYQSDEETTLCAIRVGLYVIGILFIAGGIGTHLLLEKESYTGLILFGAIGCTFIISAIACYQKNPLIIPHPKKNDLLTQRTNLEKKAQQFKSGEIEEFEEEDMLQLYSAGLADKVKTVQKDRLQLKVRAELGRVGREHTAFKRAINKILSGDRSEIDTLKLPYQNMQVSLLFWAMIHNFSNTETFLRNNGALSDVMEEVAAHSKKPAEYSADFLPHIIELFCGRANNPNIKLGGRISLLEYAYTHHLGRTCDFLCKHGAIVGPREEMARCANEREAVTKASDNCDRDSQAFIKCIQSLLNHEKQFFVNATGWYARDDKYEKISLLQWAVITGNHATARWLMDQGATINQAGVNSLHWFAENGFIEGVERLLKQGVSIDVQDQWGDTALHRACRDGKVELAQKLMQLGAKPEIRNNRGDTPLTIASENHAEIFEPLLKTGNTALHRACKDGRMDVVRSLVERGADVNQTNNAGQTPLMIVAQRLDARLANYLLDAGADELDRDDEDQALQRACRTGNREAVKFFIAIEADSLVEDPTRHFLRLIALEYNHPDIAELLVNKPLPRLAPPDVDPGLA